MPAYSTFTAAEAASIIEFVRFNFSVLNVPVFVSEHGEDYKNAIPR